MADHSLNLIRGLRPYHWVMLLAPAIFVTGVIVFPFVTMVSDNISGSFFSQITGSGAIAQLTRKAIYNSTVQGSASAVLSFITGLPLGLFLGKYRFRMKRLATSLIIIPFFLPSLIVVFAFISGFGNGVSPISLPYLSFLSRGFPGIVAVNTFFNAPLVALFTMTAVEQSDVTLNEAAMTLGAGKFRRFRTIWGRDGITAAMGAALLTFTYSFAGFAAPLIIGGPSYFTLDAWIYFMVKTLGNLDAAIVLALLEATILLAPALLYAYFSGRQRRVSGSRLRIPSASTGPDLFFRLGAVFTLVWIAVEIYLLSSVVLASLDVSPGHAANLSYYAQLFGSRATSSLGIATTSAIMNSMFYGTITALAVVSLGLLWMTGKRRLRVARGWYSEFMHYIPLIISSIIMAFAISIVLGAVTPITLVWVLIIIAQTGVAIPVVLRVIDAGFSSIPEAYSEASITLGGSPFFEIELPLARSTFASALMFGFAISLGEFSATNFIATTNYITLTVEMYLLQGVRLIGASYAAATILLCVSLVAFYIIQRLGERFVGLR